MGKRNEILQKDIKIPLEARVGVLTAFMQFVSLLVNNGFASCVFILILVVIIFISGFKCFKKSKKIDERMVRNRERISNNDKELPEIEKRNDLSEIEKVDLLDDKKSYSNTMLKKNDELYEEKQDMMKRFKRLALSCMVACGILFVLNADSISAFAAEFFEEEPTQEEGDESEEIVEGMTFYLDNVDMDFNVSEDIDKIFYVHYKEENIDNVVKFHMQELMSKRYSDKFSNNLSFAEEMIVDQAAQKEILFEHACDEAKKHAIEGNYEMWSQVLEHSSELDEIIDLRCSVWDSGKCDAEIASLIANDYQAYALEFEHQKKNGYAILYYYMQCIIWSERAISYEDADNEIQFNYIKKRYFDIANCELIPDEYRDDANAIYNSMGEYGNYIIE